MADSAHLEKMGRELKCPICLSLLNSAVSLSCNHMFCNLCITKSMKSCTECPVCKAPYRRREIRPAPHMDNLVSIYKNMEAASGVNIFGTQTAPVTKVSDKQDDVEKKSNSDKSQAIGNSHERPKRKKISKRKGLQEPGECDAKVSDSNRLNPSFPAKKRVHVPQCLQSETPLRSEKCVGGSGEDLQNDCSNIGKENQTVGDKGDSAFAPFYWLREEDENDEVDQSSDQQVNRDRVSDTPPAKLPSFSDIRDSDSDSPTKNISTEGVNNESKVADMFDSEMFEWTQRACSPELFSTPEKNKAKYHELGVTEEDEYQTASQNLLPITSEEVVSDNVNGKEGNGSKDMKLFSSLKAKNTKARSGCKKSNKNNRKTLGRAKGKGAKVPTDEIHVGSIENSDRLNHLGNCVTNGIVSNTEKKYCKRNKKASRKSGNTVAEDGVNESIKAKSQERSDANLPMLSKMNPKVDQDIASMNKACGSIKTGTRIQKSHLKSSRKQTTGTNEVNVPKEAQVIQNQEDEDIQVHPLSSQKDDSRSMSILQEKTRSTAKRTRILAERNCAGESSERKRLKVSNDDSNKNRLNKNVLGRSVKAATKEIQTITKQQENTKNEAIGYPNTFKKVLSLSKDTFLKKCESLSIQVQCAFCGSATDSEATGEMLHYFQGKPVVADYNGGSNIIHSHRNCTEWAPDVYFEDETAVNLETELARSRRIKCSCCGIKGAALGCYEKSCRKSFHVPCAKSVAECRWDTENYVMLCPLHSSLKLPKENLEPQVQKKRKSMPKGEPLPKQAKVMVQQAVSTSRPWRSAVNKWVICCSGLTDAEKDIISEFTRVTGVSVSKTFAPSVTHVIASTDENGACKRTLKFLKGILEGKWILRIDWISACLKAMEFVAEEQYEVKVDIHGIKDGPRLGRLRVSNKKPKLFSGLKFYIIGEFNPSFKGYLQDLIVAAGGTVLHRKPITVDQHKLSSGSSKITTLIIYSVEELEKSDPVKKLQIHNLRRNVAKALASSTESQIAPHSWLLDSIAACKLQKIT